MSGISSSRPAQNAQKKYYADGASFRVFRAPVMSSLSYTATAKLDPGYQSTPSDNRYYASYGDARPFTTDDRSRTPRYFSDPDNRKPAPEYPIYSHFPPDDYIYEHPFSSISDIYSSSYDDHISTPTTTYSIVVSDDTSISMPELASDRSDFSNPNSPVDSGSPRMPVPSVPNTSPQPQAAYSSNFRNRTDAGYSTPRLSIPDSDPSLRSGPSNDNARLQTDSRRHPVFHQARSGNVPTAMATPSGQVPYAESVLSVESEDDVHKIAKINAEYNAAASAMYGTLGRGSLSGPGLVPSMPHMATPIAVPRDSTARQIFTDAPLTSSPTQIRYADELQRSTSYRENRSSDGRPVYGSASYRPAVPPARHADDFLPPLNEWDESRIPSTPWNSPDISYELYNPTSRSRRASDRETENPHSRPLPIPPPQARMYGTSEGAPVAEKVLIVQRSPEMPSKQLLPDDRKGQQRNDVPEQQVPYQTKQSSSSRRERRGSVSVQAEPATSIRSPPSSVGIASVVAVQYSSDEYENGEVTRSSSTRKSKDRRRAAAPDDAQRVPENTSSTSPPHEPRFIPKVETPNTDRSQPPSRHNSTSSPTLAPVEENRTSGNRPGRSSREGAESSDREGSSRNKKSSSSYDRADKNNGTSSSPREERSSEKSKSSRHGQDRAQKEQSSRSFLPTPTSTENPYEYERRKDSTSQPPLPSEFPTLSPTEKTRRRRDSTSQPPPPSEIPIISPTLVPLARPSAPQADQMSRSYSRGGPPIVTVETQGIYQRPSRRYSDDDRSLSSNGSYSGRRDSTTPTSATANQSYSSYTARPPAIAPEPQRRYSDGDVPPPPPFFKADAVTRQPSMGGGRRTMPNPRTVRWDDNLICPSPVLASQRREGWFNRRGDQLWTNDGLYRPAPAGQEYPQDLEDYPEYGEGWMNEKCVRIDMGHRLIPKTPLRPALKQTQQR